MSPLPLSSPIHLPAPTHVSGGWEVDSRGSLHICLRTPHYGLPMKNLGNPELLAETVFSSDSDFSSAPSIIMPYYADQLGYYTSTFVIMYMAAWATVHQPEGFEALTNCFYTPDEGIFPRGSKHYLHAVVRPTPPPIPSPVPLVDSHLIEGWAVQRDGTVSIKQSHSEDGPRRETISESIRVPHWAADSMMDCQGMPSFDEEEEEEEELGPPALTFAGPQYPPGALIVRSRVVVVAADLSETIEGNQRVNRNWKKKEKKARNKVAREKRLEAEFRVPAASGPHTTPGGEDPWTAPSPFDPSPSIPFPPPSSISPLEQPHTKRQDFSVNDLQLSNENRPGHSAYSSIPGPSRPPTAPNTQCYVSHLHSLIDALDPCLPIITADRELMIAFAHLQPPQYDDYWQDDDRYSAQEVNQFHGAERNRREDEAHRWPSNRLYSGQFDQSPGTRESGTQSAVPDSIQWQADEACMAQDEACTHDSAQRNIEETSTSPSCKQPLREFLVGPAPTESDAKGRMSLMMILAALNDIMKHDTLGYETLPPMQCTAAFSNLGHQILPFPKRSSNKWYGRYAQAKVNLMAGCPLFRQHPVRITSVHTTKIPVYCGPWDDRISIKVFGPDGLGERALHRFDYSQGPVAAFPSKWHFALISPRRRFSLIPEPTPSQLIGRNDLYRVTDDWLAEMAGLTLWMSGRTWLDAPLFYQGLRRLNTTMKFEIRSWEWNGCAYTQSGPIDKEVSGAMFYANHRPINFKNYQDDLCFFLQALERWGIPHWGIEADEDVGRFELDDHSGPSSSVTGGEERHQSTLNSLIRDTTQRIVAYVPCEIETAALPFTAPLSPKGSIWTTDLEKELLYLTTSTLDPQHPESKSFLQFSQRMQELVGAPICKSPLLTGNHLPAQEALIFVPPAYHDPHKSAPSALGATKEAMRPSSDLFAMKMEMTPAVMPDVWYGLVVEIFHTQEELMDTVALAEAQGADGWKQHKVAKNGLSLGLIFKSLVCRDDLFHTLKQDDRFSNITLLNFTQIHAWLPYQMWKDPGYLQHLWARSRPVAVHAALLGQAPPSRHCPPSTPHMDFAREKERSRQELLLVELLEAEKYPPIIRSSGPDPPKRAYSRVWFSREFLASLCQASPPLEFSPPEALSLQCLEIVLNALADYNLSFTKSVYASESGPYVKLLRFIASKVETAVKSQSTQCDLVSEAQQGKLNVLQLPFKYQGVSVAQCESDRSLASTVYKATEIECTTSDKAMMTRLPPMLYHPSLHPSKKDSITEWEDGSPLSGVSLPPFSHSEPQAKLGHHT
ncbi:hypothetical protein BS47DRAFT_1401979 [Hydnum rufescens UP504]|uniref:Uncharacterized protein n=1 Tax=Hydnum rufescens UP504 TaxID=1448309 RepID=A0A9P6ADJ0_9AGAM|nr:hypothetical protein BS47DRAFT_1401979 [Hydnum rufescens UP504]